MRKALKNLTTAAAWVLVCGNSSLAQTPPPTILVIDVQGNVTYWDDVGDPSKYATSSGVSQVTLRNFQAWINVADIVAVNGGPAKGTLVCKGRNVFLGPNPNPAIGGAIADISRGNLADVYVEIQQPDGTPVGTIVATGFVGGSAPPGAPTGNMINNLVVTGGTGAFLGARGQMVSPPFQNRFASMIENPAARRVNGGTSIRFPIIHLIPMSRPEIATNLTGPAIFHADFSPVTAAKPAKAGEVLIVKATGLGPTVPGVDPGQTFPTDALRQVNSPVDVTVNGQSAEVVNKIGWPGQVDTYRLDFRVPDGTAAGMVPIQLTVAWISGASVNIPFQ